MVLSRVDLNDGVASHVDTLTANLAAAGHEVVMFTGPVSGPESWRHRERAILGHTVAWERTDRFGPMRETAAWLRDAVRRQPVDLLHVHGLRPIPIVRWAFRWHLPVVATAHPSRTSTPDPKPLRAAVLRLARPLYRPFLPDRVIGVSSEMGRWFVNVMGVAPSRVRVVLHGCDTSAFSPINPAERAEARRDLNIPDEALACAIVGRFDDGKRHETAVAAFAKLKAEGRDAVLILAGSGNPESHVARLRRLADPAGTVDVRCLIDLASVRAVYAACDVILLPSEREAFALVVAEGMLCGLVPVRTPTGGAADQIEPGVTGLIFPIGDAAALADHLRWLIDHPDARAAMGRAAARRAADRFGAGAMAERTAAVYRELTGDRRDPTGHSVDANVKLTESRTS
jgi:glycosyltransferase involved in cell wall biosynthesis